MFLSPDPFPVPNLDDDSPHEQASAKSRPPARIVYDFSAYKELPTRPTPEEGIQRLRFPEDFKTFEVPDDIVYLEDGPRPDQVVMLMASDGQGHNSQIPHLFERALENRREYAELHGYNFHFLNITRYGLGGAHAVCPHKPSLPAKLILISPRFGPNFQQSLIPSNDSQAPSGFGGSILMQSL